MRVGVNYPWLDYGWDFGLGPPQWRAGTTQPHWRSVIDEHLRRFQDLGVSVVRWFILGDGLTYGSGGEAPQPGARPKDGWRFDPPALHQAVLDDFAELLERFVRARRDAAQPLQLLPVLVDFLFCAPGVRPCTQPDPADASLRVPDPAWVKQGRADAITDSGKRERFLARALEPLLRVSQASRDVVYAWELINEPEWVTNAWHPDRRRNHPIDAAAMRAFIEEGSARVREHGFKPTIGFASYRTLRRLRITTEIRQFHHYPGGRRRLRPHTFDPLTPCIIGELATAASDVWPELRRRGQTLLNRLRLASAQGYPLAIPWSFLASDRHSAWAQAEVDLQRFARDRVAPGKGRTAAPRG